MDGRRCPEAIVSRRAKLGDDFIIASDPSLISLNSFLHSHFITNATKTKEKNRHASQFSILFLRPLFPIFIELLSLTQGGPPV